jgi:glycosyltransferase involved in cell wall biosynthesis
MGYFFTQEMKIAFVLVNHLPDDERVRFQEANSLQKAGCEVFTVSTRTDTSLLPHTYCFDDTGMPKRLMIKKVASLLVPFVPDVIICDNPVAVLAAQHYRKLSAQEIRIIYDVTEWYPSYNNLRGLSFVRRVVKSLLLTLLSLYSAHFLSGFIFGEYYKAVPFRFFFPWKKYIYLPYYADTGLVKTYPERDIKKECVFLYAGNLTRRKGFDTVLNVARKCAGLFPDTRFILRILSSASSCNSVAPLPANMEMQFVPFLPFPSFCEEIGKADICFDLREINIETRYCLPIKLFYYMAAGRPAIYSDLKAIRKGVPETDWWGNRVDPQNTADIISIVSHYINDSNYYRSRCAAARRLAEEKYNWGKIESRLISFICLKTKNRSFEL